MNKQEREAKKAEANRIRLAAQKAGKKIKGANKLLAFEIRLDCFCCSYVGFFKSRERAVQFIEDNEKNYTDYARDDAGIEFVGRPCAIERELTRTERQIHLANLAHRFKFS